MDQVILPGLNEHGVVILVSGWRRVGKTTLLVRVCDAARDTGLSTGGFLSVARFADGEKTGIDLYDAASGVHLPLATLGDTGAVQTGQYTFNPEALAAGLRFAENGQRADVFFVDEIGPLELDRGAGWSDVIPMIRARPYGCGFVVVRPELVARAREALALAPDSPMIDVTPGTRNALTDHLTRWIRQYKPRGATTNE